MPLPIAQLGYIPNMGSPSHGTNIEKDRTWEKLAAAFVGNLANQMAGNAMSRDYASQATASNPEQVSAGPMIDPGTGQAVPGSEPTKLGPQDAGFFSKLVSGPQMNERAYDAEMGRRAVAKEGTASRKNAVDVTNIREKGDNSRAELGAAVTSKGQDLNRLSDTERIGLNYDQMLQQAGLAREQMAQQNQGSVPQNTEAQAAMIRAQSMPTPDRTAAEGASVNVLKAYMEYQQNQSSQALKNKAMGIPNPPSMTFDQFIQMYDRSRPAYGLQQFPAGTTP